MASPPAVPIDASPRLIDTIVCPHCWTPFPPEDLRFIATSPELSFDHIVPGGAPRRFVPSLFTFEGDGIDPGGGVCTETACPHCHLKVPRLLAQRKKISVSIFGAPGSGKSFLLAAMTHKTAEVFPDFGLTIDDVDQEANAILHDYERELFAQPTPTTRVQLRKTEQTGDWYNRIKWRGRERSFPKPFLFRLDSLAKNHNASPSGRVLCLYDNAGESFEPGGETEGNPVTRHMAQADGLIFVFDPTQEPAFRKACQQQSDDHQWTDNRLSRQSSLFSEAMDRILKHRGQLPTSKIETPLIVLLPKFDAWRFLLGNEPLPQPWLLEKASLSSAVPQKVFDAHAVLRVSHALRAVLDDLARPMLTRIESVCDHRKVLYLPVSATGCSPRFDPPESLTATAGNNQAAGHANKSVTGNYFLAGEIDPIWAEVPALTLLRMTAPKLLPTKASAATTQQPS